MISTSNTVRHLEIEYDTVSSKQQADYAERIKKLDDQIVSTQEKMKTLQSKIDDLLDNNTQNEKSNNSQSSNTSNNKSSAATQNDSSSKTVPAPTTSNKEHLGDFTITYYCTENYPHICGTGDGQTASGAKATPGVTVAADTSILPMGTKIYIEGIGERVVQDVGGAVKGNHIDVCVNTHSEAMRKGKHSAKVYRVN